MGAGGSGSEHETTLNIPALIATVFIVGLLAVIGYWWYKKNKPIHTFIGMDFGANSVQPRRIKNLYGPFKVKRNDGQKVNFPVPAGYHIPRQDGKGTIFFGDLATGQLFNARRDASGKVSMDFVHGIFMEKAFSDGRVQQIVAAMRKDGGIKLEHVAILVGITLLAVCAVIYMYARAGGIA